MAGAGYKLFATGDVLTAAQVNTYLMQQTVMVFASSAARTTALSGVLAEGMVSYLQDTNTLEVYDGAAWVGATGDITGLTAGTGISISSATGPVPTVTNSMATEITAKGDLIAGTGSATFDNLAVGANNLVLTADSATATGLKWAAPDPLTTKGDLFTYSTTEARLPVGTNGQVLTADSSAATGLAWATASAGSSNVAGKNGVLNSAFNVWQRGTSIAGAGGGAYTADRWFLYAGGQATASRQVTGDTTNLPFIQYCARVQRNSGSSDTTGIPFAQSFETINSIPFAGKTVTLSFYARKGANFSAASDQIGVTLATGTGTDQNYLSTGYTGAATPISQNVTITSTWQRFSYSAAVSSTATELAIRFFFGPTGTAGAADFFEVTGVQLEIASSASAYSPATATYAEELSACQRYFIRPIDGSSNISILGQATSSTTAQVPFRMPVEMRVGPTLTVSSATNFFFINASGGVGGTTTSVTAGVSNTKAVRIDAVGGGLAAGDAMQLQESGGSPWIALSAEI